MQGWSSTESFIPVAAVWRESIQPSGSQRIFWTFLQQRKRLARWDIRGMKMQTKTFTAEKDRGKSMEKKDQTRYDKAMVNRIARATGHLKMVRDMVEQERDCSEVLIQLAAVKSAVNGAGKEILKQYMEECVDQELRQQDNEGLGKLKKGIDSFMK